jgi:Leucine-rich repeat (LRR) protein
MTYCETEIDFSAFPHLQQCSLEWRRKVTSLFDCVTLKKLFLNRYKGRNAGAFGKLSALESLGILGAPVEDLLGLRNLVHLTYLRLGLLTKLRSLTGIEGLANLEELDINTCRAIGSIDEVGNLRKLKRLFLSNCGRIQSLKPLKNLDGLETVGFVESTNIVDGDLSPLMHQKSLSKVSFQNRRHYSHRREDFGSAYFGKRNERRDDGSQ